MHTLLRFFHHWLRDSSSNEKRKCHLAKCGNLWEYEYIRSVGLK
jgi:hypothetical protein